MKQNHNDLTNLAWISHFWAQYNKLPEALKDGFYSLALSIAKENVREQGTGSRLENRELLECDVF